MSDGGKKPVIVGEDGPEKVELPKKRSDLPQDPRRRERGVEPDKKGVARPGAQL